jgi:hypothetical protein
MQIQEKIKLEKSFKITIDNETYLCEIKTGTVYYFVDISIIKQYKLFGYKFTLPKFMGYVCCDIEFPTHQPSFEEEWVNIDTAIYIVKAGLKKLKPLKEYKHLEHIIVKETL